MVGIKHITRSYGPISWPSKPGDGGDDCLWNGMLCHVGYVDFKLFIFFQRPTYDGRFGMFYRNPERSTIDGIAPHYFSRDMATGVLLALCNSNDQPLKEISAKRWAKYFGNKLRYAPDNRSWITPWMVALTALVYDHHGYKGLPKFYRMFSVKNKLLQKYVLWETKNCHEGSGLHLKACSVLILRACGEYELADKIAKICYERQPWDVFFAINYFQNSVGSAECLKALRGMIDFYKGPSNVWCWGSKGVDCFKEQSGIDLIFAVKLAEKYGAILPGTIPY